VLLRPVRRSGTDRRTPVASSSSSGFGTVNFRIFLNPQPQQLGSFIRAICQALQVDSETIPYKRPFEEKEGAFLDPFSRIALGWEQDRSNRQLIVRVRWL
jgi:hypothetical protein